MILKLRVSLPDPYLSEYFQWLAERVDERMKTNPRKPAYKELIGNRRQATASDKRHSLPTLSNQRLSNPETAANGRVVHWILEQEFDDAMQYDDCRSHGLDLHCASRRLTAIAGDYIRPAWARRSTGAGRLSHGQPGSTISQHEG